MLDAVRLALGPAAATLDVEDTASLPAGATRAAGAAIAHHDAIILGPLTAAETQAAAAVVTPSGTPILSFSSDVTAARPGVWVLGLTLDQQVARLAAAAQAEKPAAFRGLPARQRHRQRARGGAGAGPWPGADIRHHGADYASINDGLKSLAAYDARAGDRDRQVKADRLSTDPAVRAQADALAAQPTPPPPFDALLLGDTGTALGQVIETLGPYGVRASDVRVMGPYLWSKFARKLGAIAGAWYAGPDPAARARASPPLSPRATTSPPTRSTTSPMTARRWPGRSRPRAAISRRARSPAPTGSPAPTACSCWSRTAMCAAPSPCSRSSAGGGAHIVSPAPGRLAAAGGA